VHVRFGLVYCVSVSFWILKFGFVVERNSRYSLFFFRFWMSLSSVIRASQWLRAVERIRQSMKSESLLRRVKDVKRILLSCAGIVSIVSS